MRPAEDVAGAASQVLSPAAPRTCNVATGGRAATPGHSAGTRCAAAQAPVACGIGCVNMEVRYRRVLPRAASGGHRRDARANQAAGGHSGGLRIHLWVVLIAAAAARPALALRSTVCVPQLAQTPL
jgi:hypothetical protein